VANYIKAVRPEIKVIGVQMNDSDAMIQSVSGMSASRWPTWACSRTAPPSSWWARKPSASRATWSTNS
jgi:cysteine synthase